ncbi:MAG TPA: S46 family peptidase [Kofleriaceae bacterium]|nr:S46 family peptidase [Kofleriaceae bacterium]
MKRNAILCGLLVAACGGSNKQAVTTSDLGPSKQSSETASAEQHEAAAPRPADPQLDFRRQYSDPGGMWMPMQMTLPQHVDTFQKMGVKLNAEALSDPLSDPLAAIVSLGGCTASFVSPDGLIVTNHHCVQGALNYNSTPEKNLIENGFLAKTRADEILASPSQRVMVVQAYKDITKEMRDGLEKIKDPIKRKEESEKRYKQQVAACEKDRPWLRCQVSSFFRGSMYQLIEMLEIKDVRLVYVPQRAVGNYGGEIDNWAWPRHTGDWSFYRAYVGKDGKPAEFSADNVPFHPQHWLKVTTAGLKPGDFVMVTGYPGSTSRLDTASEIHHDVEWHLPFYIEYLQQKYNLMESHLGDKNATAIKATNQKQFIQNGLEKFQGQLDGIKKSDILQRKDELDKKVKEWAAQPGNEIHKANIEKLEHILADEFRTARVDFERGATFGGSKFLSTALSLTRWAEQRAKKDMDRKPGFQERDLPRSVAGQKSFVRTFDRTLDRESFRINLMRSLALPEADRPWLATLLGVKKGTKIDEALIDKTLDAWYKDTKLEDEKVRIDLLTKGTMAQIKASKDPFVMAAQRIWSTVKADEKKEDARAGELVLVTPSYAEGLKAVLGGALAPDANGTLRVTYGTVKSFKPESKAQEDWAFTTASQILAKNTGKAPFDAPANELAAIKAKKFGPYADLTLGGELPVDFLSDLDITGGNSGSPTLNNKGELVGLAFDGNKEGVSSDVLFNGQTSRTIHVDARYMIWMMDAVDGADHLVKEMGLTPSL